MDVLCNCYSVSFTVSQCIKQKYDLLNLDSIFYMFHNFLHQYNQSSWKLENCGTCLQIPLHLGSGCENRNVRNRTCVIYESKCRGYLVWNNVILVAPANASFSKCLKKTFFNGKNSLLEIDPLFIPLHETLKDENKGISSSYEFNIGVCNWIHNKYMEMNWFTSLPVFCKTSYSPFQLKFLTSQGIICNTWKQINVAKVYSLKGVTWLFLLTLGPQM